MNILLGVTGGIAAYKAPGIVRHFAKAGHQVRVVMTRGAAAFITPMTLQIVSGHTVGTELFDPTYESEIGHIELARWTQVVLIAPATAQVAAKLALGMADDLLTTVVLATRAPVVVAPAMNTQMWHNALVQQNLRRLEAAGMHLVAPDDGELACQEVGPGRLPDPQVLAAAVERAVLAPAQLLAGLRVLVTAGPTREHIDPARFLSNPSTGKMGTAIAQQAAALGAQVTLVCGPIGLDIGPGVTRVDVVSAAQMHAEVSSRAGEQDLIVKAAAVADWRPKEASEDKREKSQMAGTLELERTADILAELGQRFGPGSGARGPMIVGFAAQSHDVEARGRTKLIRKGAHWLVANKIGGADSAFGADRSSAVVLAHEEAVAPLRLGPAPKAELARALLEHVWTHKAAVGL